MIVKGTIRDVITGELLLFANVYVTNASGIKTGNYTTADENGKYQLTAFDNTDKINASFVGYKPQQKPAAAVVDFDLASTATQIENEIVVTAKKNFPWWPVLGTLAIIAGVSGFIWINSLQQQHNSNLTN